MQIRKTLYALLALAIAIAFSPIDSLQAASPMGPGSQPGTENLTYTVKAKAKAKAKGKAKGKAKAKGKKAKSKGPGRCGTLMYWDKKKRSCATKVK
jgi:hypothetical protein